MEVQDGIELDTLPIALLKPVDKHLQNFTVRSICIVETRSVDQGILRAIDAGGVRDDCCSA